jgi:hypothetical protein
MHRQLEESSTALKGLPFATLSWHGAGAAIPWVPRSPSPKIGLVDRAAMALFDKFAGAAIKTGRLRVILPNGHELLYGDAAKVEAPVPKGESETGPSSSSCLLG